jgi:hypothetical protein
MEDILAKSQQDSCQAVQLARRIIRRQRLAGDAGEAVA